VPRVGKYVPVRSYVYAAMKMPKEAHSVVRFEPIADERVVHHMLLFGCANENGGEELTTRVGGMFSTSDVSVDVEPRGRVCGTKGSNEAVLFAWGKNAKPLHMPQNVGFRVGGTNIKKNTFMSLVLEVHYLDPRAEKNGEIGKNNRKSGVIVHVRKGFPISSAATLVWATGFRLPPGREEVRVENTCVYDQPRALKAFGFRVHTHELGRKVTLERMVSSSSSLRSNGDNSNSNDGEKGVLLLERDPQLPQEFEQIGDRKIIIAPGDVLKTTCFFNTEKRTKETNAGWGHTDEMCNFYLMVHSDEPSSLTCDGGGKFYVSVGAGSSTDEAKNALTRPFATDLKITKFHPPLSVKKNVRDKEIFKIGQVGGVVVEPGGEFAWVFHRGPKVVWDEYSFDDKTNQYIGSNTPIDVETILRIHLVTGAIDRKFGKDRHFMPHGISISPDAKEVWVTDCGLHQVIAYDAMTGSVLREFGNKMKPLSIDGEGFCKPTAVEILADGSFFVADGYCNHRIAMFNDKFEFVGNAPVPKDGELKVPHALAVSSGGRELAVADRENYKIVIYDIVTTAIKGGDQQSIINLREKESIDVRKHGLPYGLSAVKANDKMLGGFYVMTWNRKVEEASTVKILSMWPMGDAIFDIAEFEIDGGKENAQYPHVITAWSGVEIDRNKKLLKSGVDVLLGYTRELTDTGPNLIKYFLGVDDSESAVDSDTLLFLEDAFLDENSTELGFYFIFALMLFSFVLLHLLLYGFNRIVVARDKST
jgi:peptidylglycine monooxygenase / peptidylamidoglycolate lyase